MRIQLWGNKNKKGEDDADYVVYQRQRTGIEGQGYETVEVGYGKKMVAPSGEIYLDVKINGLTDNKPTS